MPAEYYRRVYGSMAEGRLEVQRRHVIGQRGSGFFGRIIRGSLAPIIKSVLPYLKDVALEGVGGFVSDLKDGKGMKDASKNQIRKTAATLMSDIAKRITPRPVQDGSGFRKKRRKRVTLTRQTPQPRPRQTGLFNV